MAEQSAIPELPHGCGSWVCSGPNGQRYEFFERSNVERASAAGWRVETTIDYLHRINQEIREGKHHA